MITRKVYTQLTAMNRIKRGGAGEDGQGEKKVSVPIDDLVGGDLSESWDKSKRRDGSAGTYEML